MQSISEMPIEYSPDPMPATTKQQNRGRIMP
jgi:hypothetical protein